MTGKLTEEFFSRVTQQMLKNKSVFGAVLCVENEDSSISYIGSTGNIQTGDRYFIASVTKLYITAIMLMLRAELKLSFSGKLVDFFPDDLISDIHVLNGVDYTNQITITHLLSNTSGIPDYFYYEKPKAETGSDFILSNDQPWPLEKVIQRAKTLKPKFPPGQKGKVNYSDTNYQLLGGIIEKVTGKWVGDAFKEYIFQPLQLKDTYAYHDVTDRTPVPLYHKKQQVFAPNYMASITAEGGIVSTASETMAFLKAFFNGFFFPQEALNELKQNWNMILFPGQFYFGLGLERLWTPRIFSPFKPIGDIFGFWGQSGAFAFHNPDTDLYFTGTINQLSGFGHSAAHSAMLKIIKSAK
jgi:D-alanyl-D-alanine carboxypeptidase